MTRLDEITSSLGTQNEIASRAKFNYLDKEAERKTFESRLVKAAEGKSHAERLTNAQATDDWLKFHKELARLESLYDFEKFKLEILDKEWLAQYAANKSDSAMIKRGVG